MDVAAVIADYHSAWDHLSAPDTPLGWATLLFVIALVIFIVSRGIQSLGESMQKVLGPSALIFLAVVAILLFYANGYAGSRYVP